MDVQLGNQKTPLATAAISRFLDAMEATPTLLRVGLGQLRDEEHVHRYEVASVANNEAARLAGKTLPHWGKPKLKT